MPTEDRCPACGETTIDGDLLGIAGRVCPRCKTRVVPRDPAAEAEVERLGAELAALRLRTGAIDESEAQDLDFAAHVASAIRAGDAKARELGEIRATLLVNFGAGRRWSHLCDLGDGSGQSTLALMMRVLESIPAVREAKP